VNSRAGLSQPSSRSPSPMTWHTIFRLCARAQYLIPILSDPLGIGWDLFGTKLYLIDTGLVTASLMWLRRDHIIGRRPCHCCLSRSYSSTASVP